jgi:hypothetical protein
MTIVKTVVYLSILPFYFAQAILILEIHYCFLVSDLVALIPCYNVPNVRSSFVNCVRNSFNDPNTCGYVNYSD